MRALVLLILVSQAPMASAGASDPVGPPPTDDVRVWRFGAEPRMPILRGDPAAHSPPVGIGVGVHMVRQLTPWFSLRLAIDYDHNFARQDFPIGDLGITVTRQQNLSSTAFIAEGVFHWTHRFLTLHFGIGVGPHIVFYTNADPDENRQVNARDILLGVRLDAGLTFRINRSFSVGPAFDYNFRRSSETVPIVVGGPRFRPFDDTMAISVKLDYWF